MPIGALHRRKFRTNMAILLAILVWVALLFAVAMIKMATPAQSAPAASPSSVYAVSAYYKTCTTSADCTLVTTGCDGCCIQDAIAQQYLSTYQTEKNKACTIKNDKVCGCSNAIVPTACQNGQCILYTVPPVPPTP